MNLIQFFRLIEMSIFQKFIRHSFYNEYDKEPLNYDNTFFIVPRIICMDEFSISLQIHNGAYCSTENGYRTLGHTFKDVEFGYPNQEEELLKPYAEGPGILTDTVGCIPIEVAQEIIDKHGGINWDKTLSISAFEKLVKN